MIKVHKTTADHLVELLTSPGMEKYQSWVPLDKTPNVVAFPNCYTIVNAFGKVLGCVGVIDFWKNRAEAWAILHHESGPYMLSISREVKKFLAAYPSKRLELTVECDFKAGHKWAVMLGFKLEAPCLAQYREGHNHALYSLIKE